ncbi:hypothetical protein [Streptomyces fradiae]|uniref:hypothetical protein n=1 Tax=Streptomyces fradiae TaxID=1906 RepID=UPI002942B9C6|nr:hypothetical protein [Streptomyces fradiae]WOI61039.1 hypothetical protein RYQ63_14670 [Streptomyces fradiae]
MDVESVADELYGLRPSEFTALRERRAAEARTAGDRALADRVKALRRPTAAAWASNLLVRARPDDARSLVALGEALRRAHRDLDGARLRELGRQQHVLVAALAREAQRLTAEAGERIGDSARGQVEATLLAALADPDAAGEWVAGHLSRALDAPVGFAALGDGGRSAARHLSVVRTAPGPGGTEEDSGGTEEDAGGGAVGAGAGSAGRRRGGLSVAGHRGSPRARRGAEEGDGPKDEGQGGGTAEVGVEAAHGGARERREAEGPGATERQREEERRERVRLEEEHRRAEADAARREVAAREDEVRHAADALEGSEQRAHEADVRVAELTARLREAQARREAARLAVQQARLRFREAQRAARGAARLAREAANRMEGRPVVRRGR